MRRVTGTILLVTFVLALTGSQVRAAVLTLDDCIELALQKRASIIQARGSEKTAYAGQRSALGAFLPRISASYSWSKGKETDITPPNQQATGYETVLDTTVVNGQTAIDARQVPTGIQEITEQTNGPRKTLGISAYLTLVDFSNIFDYASASAAHASAKLDVLASEQDLIYSVKTSYYAYLATVQNVAVQEDAVKRSEEQLKLIQSRFDLGSASLSDVLKQKVLYGNDRLSLLTAQNGVTNAKANLAYTIGLDPQQEPEFSSEYTVRAYEGTLDDAIKFGMDHNPTLLSSEKTLSQAVNSVRSANASYLPTLSLSGSYSKSSGTQSFPYTIDYSSKSLSYGFSVNWNIFDGFLRQQNITQASVFRNNARAGFSDTRNLTVANIKTAYLDIEQLKEKKSVSQENVDAAQEDMKITQEKYNLGAATILDLLNAQVSLKQAQVQLIQADFDLNLAIAKLENAMGKM